MASTYLEPARGNNNQIWRYVLTISAIIWVSLMVGVVLTVAAIFIEGSTDITTFSDYTMLLLAMLPFPAALLTLWGGLRLLHKRGMTSLLRPDGEFSWVKVLVSGIIWLILASASDLVLWILNPSNYTWTFDPAAFFPFLILAVLLVPIQTSTEELIFRGYLTQWMGRYSRKIWLPLLGPSIIFMLMHSLNPEVSAYGIFLTMPLYLGIGLLLSWITLKSGGIELALGLHAVNNLYASLIVTFPSSALPSPALFSIREYDAVLALIQQTVAIILYLGVLYTWKKEWLMLGDQRPAVVDLVDPITE